MRDLLQAILPHNQSFGNYMLEHDFPVIRQRRMLLNAQRIIIDMERIIRECRSGFSPTCRPKGRPTVRNKMCRINSRNAYAQLILLAMEGIGVQYKK